MITFDDIKDYASKNSDEEFDKDELYMIAVTIF